jgi:prevent-host-death family protein
VAEPSEITRDDDKLSGTAKNMAKIMTATEFRAKCLGLFDWVAKTGETIVITKRGKPVARVVPIPSNIEPDQIDPKIIGAMNRPD